MSERLLDEKTSVLLEKFGAGSHKPGSGSAAALQGILSAQLLCTVIALTKEHRQSNLYSPYVSRLSDLESDLQHRIIPNLEKLFEEDSRKFDIAIKFRTQRKQATDPLIRQQKSEDALSAMIIATEIPLQIARDCCELGRYALEVFDHGFRSARGDSGVAINGAIAAVAGSLAIIELNLLSFGSDHWTDKVRSSCDALQHELDELQQEGRERLLQQKKQAERHAQLSRELQRIGTSIKGGKSFSNSEIEKIAIELQRTIWLYRDLIWKAGAPASLFKLLDPRKALKCLGYEVDTPASLGNFSVRGREFEVAGQIDQVNRVVSISEQFKAEVKNFTAAHELGHALMHKQPVMHRDRPIDGSSDSRAVAPEERQADKFASFFLMPEKLLRKTFRKIFRTSQFRLTEESAIALGARGADEIRRSCKTKQEFYRLLASTTFYDSVPVNSLAQLFKVSTEAMAIRLEELKLADFS